MQQTLEPVCLRDLDDFIRFLNIHNLRGDIGDITAHIGRYLWILENDNPIGYAMVDARCTVEKILIMKK